MRRSRIYAVMLVGGLTMVAPIISSRTACAEAVKITQPGCIALAGDCLTFVALANAETDFHASASGIALTTCKGQLPAGAPLPANGAAHCNFANTGAECLTLVGGAVDWQEIVTPSGQINLSCHSQ